MFRYSPNKIIAAREKAGLNQSELARKAGLSSPSIWALEKGETKMPKFVTLSSVARALGVPVQAILDDHQPIDMDDHIQAAITSLSPANKAAILGAAKALLDSQKRKK